MSSLLLQKGEVPFHEVYLTPLKGTLWGWTTLDAVPGTSPIRRDAKPQRRMPELERNHSTAGDPFSALISGAPTHQAHPVRGLCSQWIRGDGMGLGKKKQIIFHWLSTQRFELLPRPTRKKYISINWNAGHRNRTAGLRTEAVRSAHRSVCLRG